VFWIARVGGLGDGARGPVQCGRGTAWVPRPDRESRDEWCCAVALARGSGSFEWKDHVEDLERKGFLYGCANGKEVEDVIKVIVHLAHVGFRTSVQQCQRSTFRSNSGNDLLLHVRILM
jgi:hypothetical protein